MTLAAIATDPSRNPWVFVAWFGCICGIYLFGQGVLLLRRRRRARVITKISDVKVGPVLVGGWVGGSETLAAPISGKACFHFRATVWRQESPADGNSWEIVAEETRAKLFTLLDQRDGEPGKSGRILVDPRGAKVDLPRDSYEEYGKTLLATFTDISPGLDAFLKRNKVDASAAIRVEEYLLAPASEVFVEGVAVANPAVEKQREELFLKAKAPALKTTAAVESAVTPQVIHLSPETANRPATEMTMQSRVAAALALARAKSSEGVVPNPLHIPSISIAVAETSSNRAVASAETKAVVEAKAPAKSAHVGAPNVPPVQHPPLLLRQRDGSGFSISYRHQPAAAPASLRRASLFVATGPLIAAGSAYLLLTLLGLLE
jgi:E3 Ubiquitin ligase